MKTQEVKQPKQDQVYVCGKEEHSGTDGKQPAVIIPIEVSRSTEEIFQEIKVRRAEALRLLADH